MPRGATRASSLAVLLVTTTGFVGGGGWMAGAHTGNRTAPSEPAPAPAPPAVEPHGEHHAHHAPPPASARPGDAARKHHSHDCEKGVCRCDSRCPPRRSGPCGGALTSCAGSDDEAGLNPGPLHPFLLPAAVLLRPALDRLDRPDVPFVPLTRAREPAFPPPRTASV